jgi:hypothetical protein
MRMRIMNIHTMFQFGCQKGRHYYGDVNLADSVLLQLNVGNEGYIQMAQDQWRANMEM